MRESIKRADMRDNGVVIHRRRRRRGPFQRTAVPGIARKVAVFRLVAIADGDKNLHQLANNTEQDQHCANFSDQHPRMPGRVVIVVDTTGHAFETEDIQRHKGKEEANKPEPEGTDAPSFVHFEAKNLRSPEVHATDVTEVHTTDNHVMEVGNQEQAVMQHKVGTGDGHHNTGHTTDGEHHHEANSPIHASMVLDATLIHGEQPVKELNTGRDGDDHGCDAEEGIHVRTSAHGEEVMHPHKEGQHHNGAGCVDHGLVAEERLAREGRHNFGEHTKGRQNKNVNFRMTPSPNQVQVEHLVAATIIGEEVHTEVTVQTQKGNCNRQHGEGRHDQDGRAESRPCEHGHLQPGHARCAHLNNGYEEVYASQQRANTRDLDCPDIVVNTHARAELHFGQRGISQPAALRELTNEQGDVHQHERNCRHPEAQVVQERVSHVTCANLQRHNEVEQTGHERHGQEEDHDRPVSGEDLVIVMRGQVTGVTGVSQRKLGTHHDGIRETAGQSNQRQYNVHDSQTLVIDRGKPLFPEVAPLAVIGNQSQYRDTDNENADERTY